MCRSIKTLHNFRPPATAEEIRASALQFVRKLSGFTSPSKGPTSWRSRAPSTRCGGSKGRHHPIRTLSLEKRHTYALPLEQAERAIHMLAAHGKGVNPVHLAVVPGAPKVNV